jgi:hypothetical protein
VAIRFRTLSFLSPSTNFSGSMPIGNAPTVTNLPFHSTPFGVVVVDLLGSVIAQLA